MYLQAKWAALRESAEMSDELQEFQKRMSSWSFEDHGEVRHLRKCIAVAKSTANCITLIRLTAELSSS